MNRRIRVIFPTKNVRDASRILGQALPVAVVLILLPLSAHAQTGSSPFDSGLTAMQNLFTGTIAKVASPIAIVLGGYA